MSRYYCAFARRCSVSDCVQSSTDTICRLQPYIILLMHGAHRCIQTNKNIGESDAKINVNENRVDSLFGPMVYVNSVHLIGNVVFIATGKSKKKKNGVHARARLAAIIFIESFGLFRPLSRNVPIAREILLSLSSN